MHRDVEKVQHVVHGARGQDQPLQCEPAPVTLWPVMVHVAELTKSGSVPDVTMQRQAAQ